MYKYCILSVLLLVSGVVFSAQVILSPTDDSSILEDTPDQNYGSHQNCNLGFMSGGWWRSLLCFDLSPYMGVIVEDASLQLHVYGYWLTNPSNNYVYQVDGAWDESTITWNTDPGYNLNNTLYFPDPSINYWLVLDVTSFVEDWIDGTHINYGFYLTALNTIPGYFAFYTKEYTDPVYWPRLVINYQLAATQPSTWGSIKALFDQ